MLIEIARHLPIWVYLLLGYLVFVGIRALRPRILSLWRLLVVPGVFIVWGVIGLFQRSAVVPDAFLYWGAGAAVGLALAFALPLAILVDRKAKRVRTPGSVVPLLRNLGLFAAHLLLNIVAAMHADTRMSFLGYDLLVSGLGFGYFAGWLWRFVRIYRTAPHTDLTPIAEVTAAQG